MRKSSRLSNSQPAIAAATSPSTRKKVRPPRSRFLSGSWGRGTPPRRSSSRSRTPLPDPRLNNLGRGRYLVEVGFSSAMAGAGIVREVPARCVIGVDLGGTKLLAGAVDPERLTVHHRTRREVFGIDQSALLDAAVDAVKEASEAVDGEVSAVGFGIPCTFDRRTGGAVQAVNPPLGDIHFGEIMEERLGLPVEVDNDANCAVWAEARAGAAAGCTDVALLTIGTGIGGGLVLGGRLYRGFAGAGAEMGHMVVDIDGPPCQGNCPNWGCLEAVASGSALVREAALRVAREPDTPLGRALEDGRPLTGPLITELAFDGDPVAGASVRVIGEPLGVGIANLVNIFNPEVVVIGGGVIAAGDLLLDPAREVMAARALAPSRDLVRVAATAFGAESGMIGAALLAAAPEAAGGARIPRRGWARRGRAP